MDKRDALKRILGAAALAACAAASVGNANAAWPERPVTLIVPWGAGGGTDATARIIGSLLEKELGQPVTSSTAPAAAASSATPRSPRRRPTATRSA